MLGEPLGRANPIEMRATVWIDTLPLGEREYVDQQANPGTAGDDHGAAVSNSWTNVHPWLTTPPDEGALRVIVPPRATGSRPWQQTGAANRN